MTDGGQENAMTEIALAMAMGFFSIMVLTALSMGVSRATRVDTTILVPPGTARSTATETVGPDDILVIYDGKTFFDRQLRPLNPATLPAGPRRILAVPPQLAMADAVSARQRLVGGPIVVTTLDENWQRTMKEVHRDRR